MLSVFLNSFTDQLPQNGCTIYGGSETVKDG